jgi:cytochrome d ubiquinol oxidase subunit II
LAVTLVAAYFSAEAVKAGRFFYMPIVCVILGIVAILSMPGRTRWNAGKGAFATSSFALGALLTAAALSLYPNLVYSTLNPEYSLNVWNSASSPYTLKIMLTITLIGMPVVLIYTAVIHRIFRGKAGAEHY